MAIVPPSLRVRSWYDRTRVTSRRDLVGHWDNVPKFPRHHTALELYFCCCCEFGFFVCFAWQEIRLKVENEGNNILKTKGQLQ